MADILNKAQAEAVYSAMCALNNIGAKLDVQAAKGIRVYEALNGSVQVRYTAPRGMDDKQEGYTDQNHFAQAYGLNTGA